MSQQKQLSLFEEPEAPKPAEPPLLGPKPPDESDGAPSPSHVTRAQQKQDVQRFMEYAEGIRTALQPHVAKRLVVKRIYGRTRYVSMKQEGQEIVLRLHRRFADAPDAVQEALLGWLKGPRRKAPKIIDQFIHELSTLIAAEQRLLPPRTDLQTQGSNHNLTKMYDEVNEKYFGGTCRVAIGWGRQNKKKKAQSRHLGSYSATHHRITINPILDSHLVPGYIVSFVIFHELLHSRQPPGTRRPHDKAFRDAEKSHPDFQRIKDWEKDKFGLTRL